MILNCGLMAMINWTLRYYSYDKKFILNRRLDILKAIEYVEIMPNMRLYYDNIHGAVDKEDLLHLIEDKE